MKKLFLIKNNFYVKEKNLVKKLFGRKKIGQKEFLIKKIFGCKKILGWKNFGEKILVKKIFAEKKIVSQKKFGWKRFQ